MWKDKKLTKPRERGAVFSFPFSPPPSQNMLKICSVFSWLSNSQKIVRLIKVMVVREFYLIMAYTTGDHDDSVF